MQTDHELGPVFTADADGDGWLEIYHFGWDGVGEWATVVEEVSPEFEVTEVYRNPYILIWAVGDADSDGLVDMVATSPTSSFSLYEAPAPGGFPSVKVFDAGWYGNYQIDALVTDLDQDGMCEVVIDGDDFENRIQIFECSGDNSFEYLGFLQLEGSSAGHVAGDFDRNGLLDLVVGDGRGWVYVFEQDGTDLPELVWREHVNPEGTYAAQAQVVDLDLDGTLEVLFDCNDNAAGAVMARALRSGGDDNYWVEDVTDVSTADYVVRIAPGHITGHLWDEIARIHMDSYIPPSNYCLYLYSPFQTDGYPLLGWGWPPENHHLMFPREVATADFDFDGVDEIIWAQEVYTSYPGAIFSIDYSTDIDPPVTMILEPSSGLWFPWNGPVRLNGVAQDDHAGIRQVEASTDEGATWTLISAYPDWSTEVSIPEAEGRFEVWLRSTDCSNKQEEPPAVWWGRTGASSPTPTPSPTPSSTPIPPLGVELVLPQDFFRAGEAFSLTARVHNPDAPRHYVPLAVVLDVHGSYWFWPGWAGYDPVTGGGFDFALLDLPTGTMEVPAVEPFPWPDLDGTSDAGLRFHGALLTANLGAVLGTVDTVEWGYGPSTPRIAGWSG